VAVQGRAGSRQACGGAQTKPQPVLSDRDQVTRRQVASGTSPSLVLLAVGPVRIVFFSPRTRELSVAAGPGLGKNRILLSRSILRSYRGLK
jgi:hypothetical protein